MNKKAQGFDVFKLLISAVVAVVLLTMLLNIIGMINPDVGQDPTKKTKELTKAALTNLNTTQFENKITFNKGVTLTSLGIAANSDELETEDVCLVLDGKLSSNTSWLAEDGKKLSYNGSSPFSAKIAVVCGYADSLEADIGGFFEAVTSGFDESTDFSECDASNSTAKYCIVAVKRAD